MDKMNWPSRDQGKVMKKRPFKSMEKKGRERREPILGKPVFNTALFCLLLSAFLFPGMTPAAEGVAPTGVLTEQERATEKFLSNLEAALAQKFFDFRNRPVIRVAVFDFTDGAGNVVKAGPGWTEKIVRRLYPQAQFDVVSQEKVADYMRWGGPASLGKLDAGGLRLWQRRINTMDPRNGIHALITGEVKRGAGRSLQIQAYLTNFQFKVGEIEIENNVVDTLPLFAEIPLPTEQALQEATEILVRGEKQALTEGRLVVLANTRGFPLYETEYLGQFNKDQPFPWDKVPYVLVVGREEWTMPKEVRIGLGDVSLSPVRVERDSLKRLEYPFLHGKCATNEVYFDDMVPAFGYRLLVSFIDLKSNLYYSDVAEVQVYPGTTTVVVLSMYVPSEKERLQSQGAPRINIFQFFGKGLELLPKG
jgi:hypothetical protein